MKKLKKGISELGVLNLDGHNTAMNQIVDKINEIIGVLNK